MWGKKTLMAKDEENEGCGMRTIPFNVSEIKFKIH